MLRLTCPNCQEHLSLSALIEHAAAREAILKAIQFPAPLGKQMLQYVSYFKPAKRALSMDRYASLLNDLLPLIEAAQIKFNGRIWPAPMPYWSQAFDAMAQGRDRLTLPLSNHNYLFKIIAGYGDKAEAKQEQKEEQGRIYGREDLMIKTEKTVAQTIEEKPRKPRGEMPEEARKVIDQLTGKKGRNNGAAE